MKNEPLDTLLANLTPPPPSDGLAARIIAAAATIPQRPSVNLWIWLNRSFAEYHLPKPTISFALLLTMGFMLGSNIGTSGQAEAADSSMIEQLLLDDEDDAYEL